MKYDEDNPTPETEPTDSIGGDDNTHSDDYGNDKEALED